MWVHLIADRNRTELNSARFRTGAELYYIFKCKYLYFFSKTILARNKGTRSKIILWHCIIKKGEEHILRARKTGKKKETERRIAIEPPRIISGRRKNQSGGKINGGNLFSAPAFYLFYLFLRFSITLRFTALIPTLLLSLYAHV